EHLSRRGQLLPEPVVPVSLERDGGREVIPQPGLCGEQAVNMIFVPGDFGIEYVVAEAFETPDDPYFSFPQEKPSLVNDAGNRGGHPLPAASLQRNETGYSAPLQV